MSTLARSRFRSKAGAPAAADIPLGHAADWYDSSAGTVQRWANVGGVLIAVTDPVPAAGGGAPPAVTTYPWTDGYLFADAYIGSAVDATLNGTTVIQQALNSATQDPITVMTHALKWTGSTAAGHFRISIPGGIDLDPYDALVFAIRDTSGVSQPFNVSFQDVNQTRINSFAPITPPFGHSGVGAGLVRRFPGDTVGGMRQMIVKLGADDAVLLASPYSGTFGGDGLGMPASGRTRAYYLSFENQSGGTRAGITYIDEIRLVRRVARNVMAGLRSGSETEQASLPLNTILNYVPPITLTRDSLPPEMAWAPDFLPYWQKIIDGWVYNGAPLAGATEEILEHIAHYWGWAPGTIAAYYYSGTRNPSNTGGPPSASAIRGSAVATNFRDLVKAQARQETVWRQGFPSDWNQYTMNGVQVYTYASFGIGQQKLINWGPPRIPMLSTVFSALFKTGIVRAIYDGAIPYYHTLSPSPTGNIRLALEAYFAGNTASGDDATYPANILGHTSGSPAGFINTMEWQTKSWEWTTGGYI